MRMKTKYESPETEIIELVSEDILTVSSSSDEGDGDWGDLW